MQRGEWKGVGKTGGAGERREMGGLEDHDGNFPTRPIIHWPPPPEVGSQDTRPDKLPVCPVDCVAFLPASLLDGESRGGDRLGGTAGLGVTLT